MRWIIAGHVAGAIADIKWFQWIQSNFGNEGGKNERLIWKIKKLTIQMLDIWVLVLAANDFDQIDRTAINYGIKEEPKI